MESRYLWALLRIFMGWLFLWAFLDKLFGLGFSTARDKSWLAGTSPTFGFLKFASKGPLADFYHAIAGNVLVDWLFMIGLLLLGFSFLLGIAVRPASYAGVLLMLLMYTAVLPPEHNPLIDEHIIYALLLLGLGRMNAGQWLGFGEKTVQ